MQRRGGPKKRFQYCQDHFSADTFLYLRAIQGHSGGNQIDPAVQDNVLLPSDFAEYIYHVGSSLDMHSIILSGLMPGGKDVKRGRQTVFFTAVNPMFAHLHKQRDHDVTKPTIAFYKQKWKIHQITVYWNNFRVAQKKGLTFYQTRSNAIILDNTLPAACFEQVVVMNSEKVLYYKQTNLRAHREKLYKNRLGTKDERILQIRTKDNPTSLLVSTGKPVAVRMRVICFLK